MFGFRFQKSSILFACVGSLLCYVDYQFFENYSIIGGKKLMRIYIAPGLGQGHSSKKICLNFGLKDGKRIGVTKADE